MKWIQRLTQFFATSLQLKLMLVMSLVVTLAMIVFGVILVNTQLQSKTTELTGRATRTANLLAKTISRPLWDVDKAGLQTQIDAVMGDPEVNSVTVIETGNVEPAIKRARETPPVNPIARRADIPSIDGKTTLGTLEIVYSSELLNNSLIGTTVLVIVIILILILLQVVGIYFSVGHLVIRPLHEMTSMTSRVAAGDYSGSVYLKSQDEMNILADAFNSMTDQLHQTLGSLEQRVKDRTADLEKSKAISEKHVKDLGAVAGISRSMAYIQDLEQLLPVIADSIGEKLGYYHAGIYLLSESGDYLIMKAASGEAGKRVLKRQDTLLVEPTSLVGFVASRKQSRVAQDVSQDATYLADPDLLETKSEAGFPLFSGTKIIGVLDVQSNQLHAFSDQDINVLTTLSNQIAISVQNARLFGETRKALAEAEKIYQQFVQQGWGKIVKETPVLGYKYSQQGLTALVTPGETQEVSSISYATDELTEPETTDHSAIISIPIKLREQTIGSVSIHSADLSSRELDEDELNILQAIVERAALALENARLLEDFQRRATRERAISEISARLSEKSDVDSILRSTAEELGKKLKDAEITVEIGDIEVS